MLAEIKVIAQEVVSNPTVTPIAALAATKVSYTYIEWANVALEIGTSVLGIVMLIVLIRYHYQKTKALIKENKDN